MAIEDGQTCMSDMAIAYERHRVGIDEFHRMVEAGVFELDARLELISGEIVERVSPIYPPHASATSELTALFIGYHGAAVTVRCQAPVTLPGDSEPQPDISVVTPDANGYWTRHPAPPDIHLLVEIADSSLAQDRRIKIPLYARAEIPEAWLVDLVKGVVRIYREPIDGEYTSVRIAKRGESISIAAFPDEKFFVNDFLPPL